MRRYFLILGALLIADQLTKFWIISNFSMYETREIIPNFFNLVYVTNKGAVFSIFATIESPIRHYFFVSIKSIALVGLTIAAFKMRAHHVLYNVSFAMIAAGAFGNLIDRLRYGAVIDFLQFYLGSYYWPSFNVADSSICVGVAILFVLNILDIKNSSNKE